MHYLARCDHASDISVDTARGANTIVIFDAITGIPAWLHISSSAVRCENPLPTSRVNQVGCDRVADVRLQVAGLGWTRAESGTILCLVGLVIATSFFTYSSRPSPFATGLFVCIYGGGAPKDREKSG